MTPEQRAGEIVNEWLNFERGRSIEVDVSPRAQIELRLAIAAAMKPSEAVKEAVRNLISVADSLAAAVEQEFGTMAPDDPYYIALTAVRQELGL